MAVNAALMASLHPQVHKKGPSICLKNAEYVFSALATVEKVNISEQKYLFNIRSWGFH